jgi:hypothetical protein
LPIYRTLAQHTADADSASPAVVAGEILRQLGLQISTP